MSTRSRLSRYKRKKPDHEEFCLVWDSDGNVDLAAFIEGMWFNKDGEVVEVYHWEEVPEIEF